MKTSNYLIALAALSTLTLVGCSDNDFLGNDNVPSTAKGNGEITFATGAAPKLTRGDITGRDAAQILDKQFYVFGWKSDGLSGSSYTAAETVFPCYLVTYEENSAYSTQSNTHSWEYVGNVSLPSTHGDKEDPISGEDLTEIDQTIKYWDYDKAQYDFMAWDIKPGSSATYQLKTGSSATGMKPIWLEFKAETADEASNIYFADKVTVKKVDYDDFNQNNMYGGYVTFKFRNLTAKVRMALYETIPGYSVTDVHFYSDDETSGTAKTYLYGDNIPASGATINIQYSDGSGEEDDLDYIPENQAVASVTADVAPDANISFGTLTPDKPREYREWYSETSETGKARNKWLGRASNDPSYATGMWDGVDIEIDSDIDFTTEVDAATTAALARNHYTYVFPKPAGELCLKVDYRLKSIDGTNDDILVTGAKAIIPATFGEWKSNFAYTYLFKISDNTNGSTGTPSTDPAGLYPITFDACVVDMVDGNAQETITELANASVTTYQFGTVVTDRDEYIEKEEADANGNPYYIYVTASLMSGSNPTSGLATLGESADNNKYKAELFLVNNLGSEKTTEEAVANYKYNKIVLTNITEDCLNFDNNIPAAQTMDKVAKLFDGSEKKIAYFAPKAGYTYAVRFTDDSGKKVYKVIKVEGNAPSRNYTMNVSSGVSVAENAIEEKVVTMEETYTDADTGGSETSYPVLGAGPLLEAVNFTFLDNSNEDGSYDAIANVAATTANEIYINSNISTTSGSGTIASKALEFEGTGYKQVYPDGGSDNDIALELAGSTYTEASSSDFAIQGLGGAEGIEISGVSSGVVSFDVEENIRGGKLYSLTYSGQNANQDAPQVLAAKTIYLEQWSLKVDKKYVNYVSGNDGFTSTTQLTLSLVNCNGDSIPQSAKTISKIGTESNANVSNNGSGIYTVTPTTNGVITISYTNATPIQITSTSYSWVLKDGDGNEVTDVSSGSTYYLHVSDGYTPAYVSTLSVSGGTITKTATTGVYKVVTSTDNCTISLKYKGIENYISKSYE